MLALVYTECQQGFIIQDPGFPGMIFPGEALIKNPHRADKGCHPLIIYCSRDKGKLTCRPGGLKHLGMTDSILIIILELPTPKL